MKEIALVIIGFTFGLLAAALLGHDYTEKRKEIEQELLGAKKEIAHCHAQLTGIHPEKLRYGEKNYCYYDRAGPYVVEICQEVRWVKDGDIPQ